MSNGSILSAILSVISSNYSEILTTKEYFCNMYDDSEFEIKCDRVSKKMESIKRSQCIKVYVFDEEKAAIEKRASEAGKTSSNYLRCCGLERVIVNKPSIDVVSIRLRAEALKNKVMNQKHLAAEASNQSGVDTANSFLTLIDEIIIAALE